MIERWTGKETKMGAKCFGEFVGTAVLVLLGDGVLANVLLGKSKAKGAGWLAISTGWAFAIVSGVFAAIACGSPNPALNPAVTLGVAIETGDFSKLIPFLAAQMLGAMAGAFLVWLNFLPPLEPNGRSQREAGLLLNNAGDSKFWSELAQRSYRYIYARHGSGRDLLKGGSD